MLPLAWDVYCPNDCDRKPKTDFGPYDDEDLVRNMKSPMEDVEWARKILNNLYPVLMLPTCPTCGSQSVDDFADPLDPPRWNYHCWTCGAVW